MNEEKLVADKLESPPEDHNEKVNSKKRTLQCAGIVDEKCHPNPSAKKYRLEDVVRVAKE